MEDNSHPPDALAPREASLAEMAFWQLVERLADPQMDPAELVGAVKDKVDAIEFVDSASEKMAELLKARAKPFTDKARAILANRERLRDYVCRVMKEHSFERIPGNNFQVSLRNSPPALKMDRPATVHDLEKFGEKYVDLQRIYVWKNERIKADLLAGIEIEGMPAKITRGNWPDFSPHVPEQLERKGKKK